MEKELNPDVIKVTQTSLGKYVKRPPLSEKLLKKPPFRFLHDIITTVLKTTGFFEGLFEEEELVSENVKDRDSKILFLNKVITVIGLTLGKPLSVKPSKIVAGQEPEKTNELLQYLAQALDKKLSSDEAVKKYKESTKSSTKEPIKSTKRTNENKKLTSKSNEKLTSQKKDSSEKLVTKNEKDKVSVIKAKQKENSTIKKESPPKKSSQPSKTTIKKTSNEKATLKQKENAIIQNESKEVTIDAIDSEQIQNDLIGERNSGISRKDSGILQKKQDFTESKTEVEVTSMIDKNDQGIANNSYVTTEKDVSLSLHSIDVDNNKIDDNQDNQDLVRNVDAGNKIDEQKNCEHKNTDLLKEHVELQQNNKDLSEVSDDIPKSEFESLTIEKNNQESNTRPQNKVENNTNVRPTSVRPSSSRPGAPRLRGKHDSIITGTDTLLVGKVNIIEESTPNEEEEDSSIIIVEQQTDNLSTSQDQPEQLQLSSNEHGHLVQQILDSQKEFSQFSGKTEIEWQFGAQKAREALNQEIEQLRYNIQGLSRVANPLGKLLDHIQEDVEVMRQELQQWTKAYEESSKELFKQKIANEDSLLPLHTKLKQLNMDIEEKHEKINDLKIVIHKNTSRIEKLLANGNVQY